MTLPELLTAIAILGILIAIAVIIFLALLERPGGPRSPLSGQVNGRTQTAAAQVALGNRMW